MQGVSTVMVQRAQLTIEDLESPIKRSMEQVGRCSQPRNESVEVGCLCAGSERGASVRNRTRSSAARGHSSSARQAPDKPDKVNKENNPGRGPTGAASGAQAAPLQMPREAPRRPSGPPVAEANLLVIPIPSTTHECARAHARTHKSRPADHVAHG